MDPQQRYLRRLWLLDNIQLILREAAYHRDYDVEESLPGIPLWKLGTKVGEAHVP